jgi:hypothetical protein
LPAILRPDQRLIEVRLEGKPRGKGIPIRKPRGATTTMAVAIRAPRGSDRSDGTARGSTNA